MIDTLLAEQGKIESESIALVQETDRLVAGLIAAGDNEGAARLHTNFTVNPGR